jgi:uncharacterized membrane protein YbhN (UPF0104 family)
MSEGDPAWLAAALVFEALSFGGYVVIFRAVFSREPSPVGWRASYRITMAGVVATRLLATAGAGGVALTAWALHREGLDGRRVAAGMTTFLVLLYAVYMLALVAGGVGLRTGVLGGPAPFGLTVVPAVFGTAVIAAALALGAIPASLGDRTMGSSRMASAAHRTATVAATVGEGIRDAITLALTGDPRLLGAVAWWAFDIGVLWACLAAFGDAPQAAVIVMAYFIGMLGNLLPLPGGVGGVDGAMIGALIGFGVADGLAIVAVLVYRGFAFWLPVLPGVVAYVELVRASTGPPAVTPTHGRL